MKKIITIITMILIMSTMLCACLDTNGSRQDTINQREAASRLQNNQPTPTDIDYSIERYNNLRRIFLFLSLILLLFLLLLLG